MDTDTRAPARDEALVRVEACGFCGSDLGIVSGRHPRAKPPLTIGHEICGEVVQSSTVPVGQRVVLYPLISCGECRLCRTGQAYICRTLRVYGFDFDGGMAEYLTVPARNLMRVPQEFPAKLGAMVEPLAVAVHAISRTTVPTGETALVIGAGPIGLLIALLLRHNGYHAPICDVSTFRQQLARSAGLEVLEPGLVVEAIREATDGEGASVVFECAGHPSVARMMTDAARCHGVVVNAGVFKQPVEVDLQSVNFKELTVIGSRVYTREDFLQAIQLAPKLDLDRVITHSLGLEDASKAYDLMRAAEAGKVVLVPESRAGGAVQ
jgi:2-desacetyl-2-hydroxyethyl bacteriochlorophyllide A dehydrogenase